MSVDPRHLPADGSGLPVLAERLQALLLHEAPSLTRPELAEQSGVDLAVAEELWRLLGLPQVPNTEIAFTPDDRKALQLTGDLVQFGIISPQSQAALVRTLARSFARLAEWQTSLLHEIGEEFDIGAASYLDLVGDVLPRIEFLQSYIWRRHLASASASRFATEDSVAGGEQLTIGFVDIVGYTARSKKLDAAELISWVEQFEATVTAVVVDHGGQVIKTIGDEALFVVNDPRQAAEIGLVLTAKGNDDRDEFPSVRSGLAYGNVVRRLGDVLGPTVNIAARLTAIGRPGSVIADRGVHDTLCRDHGPTDTRADDLVLRRLPSASVKGYSKLQCWVVRRPAAGDGGS